METDLSVTAKLQIRIDPAIQHFCLPDLLPETHALTLNPKRGILTRLAVDEQAPWPQIVAEQQFSRKELGLLLPLLHAYPQICPLNVLLAHFLVENPDKQYLESCRLRLIEAKQAGTWDEEMRQTRNRISVARTKLHACGLDIGSVVETGYLLLIFPERKRRHSDDSAS